MLLSFSISQASLFIRFVITVLSKLFSCSEIFYFARAAVTVVVYYVGGFIVVNAAVILQMEYYFFTHLGAYIRVQLYNLLLAYVVIQSYIPQNFRALFSVYFFSCFHIFTLSEHKEKRPKIERFKFNPNAYYIRIIYAQEF